MKISRYKNWLVVVLIGYIGLLTMIFPLNKAVSEPNPTKDEDISTKSSEINEYLKNIEYWSRISNIQDSSESVQYLRQALKHKNPIISHRASWALRGIGTGAEEAVPDLLQIIEKENINPDVKRSAIWALRGIDANLGMHELINLLSKNESNAVKIAAIEALGSLNNKANKSVDALISLLENDPDIEVKEHSASALIKIDISNSKVQEALLRALEHPSWNLRSSVAEAFNENNVILPKAVPALIACLQNKNTTLRSWAIAALGDMGKESKEAIPELRKILTEANVGLRSYSAETLGRIGISDEKTIVELRQSLEDTEPAVRLKSAKALGILAFDDSISFNALLNRIRDPNEDENIKQHSAEAILKMSSKHIETYADNTAQLKEFKGYLNEVVNVIQDPNLKIDRDTTAQIIRYFKDLDRKFTNKYWSDVRQFIFSVPQSNSTFFPTMTLEVIALTAIKLVILNLFIFFIMILIWLPQPLLILKWSNFLKQYNLPTKKYIGKNLSFSEVLFWFLPSRDRVYDAWVNRFLDTVRPNFNDKKTVKQLQPYIPNAVCLNEQGLDTLTSTNLQAEFEECLLFWGEGGIGKTTLACQIAKWGMSPDKNEWVRPYPMIPILIEEDLDLSIYDSETPLLSKIGCELREMTGVDISGDFIKQLLLRGRVLVIIDHLSEMRQSTRNQIHPESLAFPIKSLIITSRIDEKLGHINRTTLQPCRIRGHQISAFLDSYFREHKKSDKLKDAAFFEECSKLVRLSKVDHQGITVMLAKLYANQLMDIDEYTSEDRPQNIPGLVLSYLSFLNTDIQEKYLKDVVEKDAMTIAWECLKESYKPYTARKENLVNALAKNDYKQVEEIHNGGENKLITANERLNYLEKRLSLIQTVGIAGDRIRFQLNILAEYLAGLYLVSSQEDMNDFLATVEKKLEGQSEVLNFLSIVYECCLYANKENESKKLHVLILNNTYNNTLNEAVVH